MTNYTCGRFHSETDVTASVTAAVILLVLAFVTASILYCAFQGWVTTPTFSLKPTPTEFKLLDDEDSDDNDDSRNQPEGLIEAETVLHLPDPNLKEL